MSVKVSFLAGLSAIVGACVVGCRVPPPPPANDPSTNAVKHFIAPPISPGVSFGTIDNWLQAMVSPGPPRWCYVVESRTSDTGGTNVYVPPAGFPGPAFTNVQIVTAGCTLTNVSPGWQVEAGSHFTLINPAGGSVLKFCLDCLESTNGTLSLTVIMKNGTNVSVGPLAGPRP